MSRKTVAENNIHEIHAKNTFVKIKPAFGIGRFLFSFVETNEQKKAVKTIDCYLSIADAALLAKKITSFRLYQQIQAEKQKGDRYPGEVWKSPLGGVNEAEARRRGLREDGKAVSRVFSIAPGASQYAVLTARQQAGQTDAKGLIVPVQDNKAVTIRVAVGNHDELEKLGIMIEAAVTVFMAEHTKKTSQIPEGNQNPYPEQEPYPPYQSA